MGLGLQACASSGPPDSTGIASSGGRESIPQEQSSGTYKVGAPYRIAGRWYYPKEDPDYRETGIASWYGPGFNGKQTANGETYDQNALTAAHRTLPMPSIVRVTNLDNGRSIKVRINDRGPFARSRIIDLSQRGAELLGFTRRGTAKVLVEIVADENRRIASAALTNDAAGSAPAPVPTVEVTAETLPGSAEPTLADSPAASQTALAVPRRTVSTVSRGRSPVQVVNRRPVGSNEIYVQAGAFTDFNNANRLRARLSPIGNVTVAHALVDDTEFFRVRLGPVATVEAADSLLDLLLDNGFDNARVVVD